LRRLNKAALNHLVSGGIEGKADASRTALIRADSPIAAKRERIKVV
jgi:hypothetical protein